MATLADLKKARVTVEIDGIDFELIPSPSAILNLSAKYDGLQPLHNALARLNVHAMADVVIQGLSLEGQKARDMMMSVASSDLMALAKPLSDFVGILANGGRPLREEKHDQEGGKNPL